MGARLRLGDWETDFWYPDDVDDRGYPVGGYLRFLSGIDFYNYCHSNKNHNPTDAELMNEEWELEN